MSTRVSVVLVLVGEFKLATLVTVSDGDVVHGDCNEPLSRVGKIFVRVFVTVRCDDDGE